MLLSVQSQSLLIPLLDLMSFIVTQRKTTGDRSGVRRAATCHVAALRTFLIWCNENPLISENWRENRPIALKFQISRYSISPFSSPFLNSSCDVRVWLDAVAESDSVKCNYSVNKSWLPDANRHNIRHVSTKLRFLPTKFSLAWYLCMSNYRL